MVTRKTRWMFRMIAVAACGYRKTLKRNVIGCANGSALTETDTYFKIDVCLYRERCD